MLKGRKRPAELDPQQGLFSVFGPNRISSPYTEMFSLMLFLKPNSSLRLSFITQTQNMKNCNIFTPFDI